MTTTLEASVASSQLMSPEAVAILGPKLAAELTGPTERLSRQIDVFAWRLAAMTDEEIREQFHCDDKLVKACRELQEVCGL